MMEECVGHRSFRLPIKRGQKPRLRQINRK
nr:MAG TPA: hypothetical protein [Caudoviricetes sp.]